MHKIPSFISAIILSLCCVLFFTTCQKEYSYEGGISGGSITGTALYTLKGAGGNCSGSVLIGEYYSGIPLTANNTIRLQVNVDSIGTYAITTNAANGISFSGSGTFTSTGEQTISLNGNGTPTANGDFTFTPPVGLGCDFTVSVITKTQAVAAFTFQGAPNNCTNAQVNGDYTPGLALKTTNEVIVSVNVTTVGAYSIATDTLDGISFSSSGMFTTNGVQNVTLKGSGTPVVARYLSFTPSGGTTGCTFTVSVVDPEPLATYVLESGSTALNPCIYTVQGTYSSTIPLSVSEAVNMRVFVTVPGNFTIATNASNGMMFSYSGVFTTTGTQYVLLTGSGTPAAAGDYTFFPQIIGPHPLGGESCSFTVQVQ